MQRSHCAVAWARRLELRDIFFLGLHFLLLKNHSGDTDLDKSNVPERVDRWNHILGIE